MFTGSRRSSTRRAHDLLQAGADVTALPGLTAATKERYATWTLRYMRFLLHHNLGDPRPKYLRRFLHHLAVDQAVPAPHRRTAAEALTFFHEVVLGQTVTRTADQVDLLTEQEQREIVERMNGTLRLLAVFVFATGLSVDDVLRLRVGDVDLDGQTLVVRDDDGRALDRMQLPEALVTPLRNHLAWVRSLHGGEVSDGRVAAPVPDAIRHRFPGADRAFAWQFLFPAADATLPDAPSQDAASNDPSSGESVADAADSVAAGSDTADSNADGTPTRRPIRGVMDASPLRRALDAYAGTKTRVLRVE